MAIFCLRFAQNPGSELANKAGSIVVNEADNMGAKQEFLPSWQLANNAELLRQLSECQGWSKIVSILKGKRNSRQPMNCGKLNNVRDAMVRERES